MVIKGMGQPHGGVRGMDLSRRSSQFEGRFGRVCRGLPEASYERADLVELADAMIAAAEPEPTPETERDAEENVGTDKDHGIPAGYTYLGQFIDHDLTFDPVSSLQRQNDVDGLVDFRSPRFDLDSLYGRGPSDQPYLYEDDAGGPARFRLGRRLTGAARDPHARDLPRIGSELKGNRRKRAVIGDPRNDENVIVSQLHAIFLRFHNALARDAGKHASFEEVQRLVRWHYQWVVLHDFLPRIVGRPMVEAVLPHLGGGSIHDAKPRFWLFKWRNEPFIPIEFAAAAYRFGHSMVRPIYRLNETTPRFPIFRPKDDANSLNGFREFPKNWAIDWDLYFEIRAKAPKQGPARVQPSYKIDTSLVDPLGNLPHSVAGGTAPKVERSLAFRNLARGNTMSLPSGQSVARLLGLPVIPDADILIAPATREALKDEPRPIADFAEGAFAGKCPLWTYVLTEAQQGVKVLDPKADDVVTRLGPVGGRIVAETFIGLLFGDRHSFLRQDPAWTPDKDLGGEAFDMGRLAAKAMAHEHG